MLNVKPIKIADRSESPDSADQGETSKSGEKNLMTCPKCGYEQGQSPECVRCGIIISKYMEKPDKPDKPDKHPEIYGESKDTALSITEITIKNITAITLIFSIILLLLAFYQKDKLPDSKDILPALFQEPVQTQTSTLAFDKKVGDKIYHITPLFNYELYGLCVTYYDSTGWWDITHKFLWKDFINIKDICVLYGFNVRTDAYKEMRFKSGSWTCFCKPLTERAQIQFHGRCLSNNHILSESKILKKRIMDAEKGDQIYFKGYLVAYSFKGSPPSRISSTTRTDTGNGACESVYVTDFKILKKSNVFWRYLFSFSVFLTGSCIVLMVIFYGKEYFHHSKKKDYKIPKADLESYDSPAVSTPSLYGSGEAHKKNKISIIVKLLILLLLLYLWAKLH